MGKKSKEKIKNYKDELNISVDIINPIKNHQIYFKLKNDKPLNNKINTKIFIISKNNINIR